MLELLPAHLLERVRELRVAESRDGQLVLYWMQTAMRVDENPALDVARHVAHHLKLPLLIYQGLSARNDYASDRHHTFIMQGAVDVAQACRELGLSYVFTLEQSGHELNQLLDRSALVIVEDMPTDPSRMFRRAALRASRCAMWAVDTACVVPMQMVAKPYERAFAFRNATSKLYAQRLKRDWPADVPEVQPYDLTGLAFEATLTSLSNAAHGDASHSVDAYIAESVAQVAIYHTVPPVLESRGGCRSGYARWEAFKRDKLRRYADDRNDPLNGSASRMSAYMHYGMVSPLRIAREASSVGGPGAEKYLDELLIWRELAYGFCHYRSDHSQYTALPSWARESLAEHRRDKRTQLYTWEELSRGATLDAFWNAAQRSLVRHGELHNNVRMTWGKAILGWCEDPRAALQLAIDLNHRYALDGRDPASYGGLLWCFGQFDRPFEPEQPIYGSVRTRPTWEHARRLNVREYTAHVSRPRSERQLRIAVIGAGLAGSLAARSLEDLGEQVELFEKSERPSGRMSTRRTEHTEFDHGAQYFTCRDRHFRRYVDSWIESGAVALWDKPIAVFRDGQLTGYSREQRYVCTPHMNEVGKRLTRLMNVHYGVRVRGIEQANDNPTRQPGWLLRDEDQHTYGPFDRVILALPPSQAAELIGDDHNFRERLLQQAMHPCWAMMATLVEPLPVDFGGAFVNSAAISWMARNQTKPGRSGQVESLVVHATPEWTRLHLEEDKSKVAELLLQELWPAIGLPRGYAASTSDAHRWMYSRPVREQALPDRCLFNADQTIIACGDWASGGRIEGAFQSGSAAVGIACRP